LTAGDSVLVFLDPAAGWTRAGCPSPAVTSTSAVTPSVAHGYANAPATTPSRYEAADATRQQRAERRRSRTWPCAKPERTPTTTASSNITSGCGPPKTDPPRRAKL